MLINSTLEPRWNQFWKFLGATSVTGTLSSEVAYTYVLEPLGLAIRGSGIPQPPAPFSLSLSFIPDINQCVNNF